MDTRSIGTISTEPLLNAVLSVLPTIRKKVCASATKSKIPPTRTSDIEPNLPVGGGSKAYYQRTFPECLSRMGHEDLKRVRAVECATVTGTSFRPTALTDGSFHAHISTICNIRNGNAYELCGNVQAR